MFKTLMAAAVIATLPLAAAATPVVMNFDTDGGTATWLNDDASTNTLLGYAFGDFEFSIFHVATRSNASGANLFDMDACDSEASCVGNDDGDLIPQTENENGVDGRLLIRQDADNQGNPLPLDDDDAASGYITFTLKSGPAFSLAGFSAIDVTRLALYSGIGTSGPLLATVSGLDNNRTEAVSFAPSSLINVGESFTFAFDGSGGVDSIVLAPVPLPAGGLLLLGGLGGLAIVRRRMAAKS
ncbi:VPLPA-CTERM sorting domain-containing protein [Gymnodinialimonas sp. 2305UL16-5]|uniref:VPLPA-CTERM sorting domain-containing protein n=1 Tax=Gymnodinialimonas mytili TaxID=3126503 RepID=UPI0030A39597